MREVTVLWDACENGAFRSQMKRRCVWDIRYSFNSSMEDKGEKVYTEQMMESVVDKVFKKYD